ncbi:MAG: efflux RND transporter periplasmic adaptor subunit [Psychrobium sp.]|nr:efflux RND transporter periplasmic adaptor subunit [Psychrobium sp.]
MRIFVILMSALLLVACNKQDEPVVKAKTSDVNLTLISTGELASSDTVLVGPPLVKRMWQYKITFLVPEGTWVKKGQPIMGFDAQQLHERLRNSKNKLATETKKLQSQALDSEQDIEKIKLDVAHTKMELLKAQRKSSQDGDYTAAIKVKKLVIDLELAKKKLVLYKYRQVNKKQQIALDYQINLAEVARLKAEVSERQNGINDLKVKAPKDGIVVYITDGEGKKSATGDSIFMAQKVMELPNLNQMIVKTTIAENDVSRVSVGQRVEIKLDAVQERSFWGKIESLGQIVRVKSRDEPRKVYDALISIDEPDIDVMRPGMAARLYIVEKELLQVVTVPQKSVHYDQSQAFVYIQGTFGHSRVDVTVAGRADGKVYIKGELSAFDEIVL